MKFRTSHFLVIAFGIITMNLFGQEKEQLNRTGYIFDSTTDKAIAFAHIKLLNGSQGGVSNQNGFFNIRFNQVLGTDEIVISCIGYKQKKLLIDQLSDTIYLIPEIKFLDKIEVQTNKMTFEEELFNIVNQHIERRMQLNYQMDCYYYSYWLNDITKDSSINEAVFTYLVENNFTKDSKVTSSVMQQRRVSDSTTLIPWPVHALGMGDFRNGVGLLSKNSERTLKVDSILTDGNNSKFYYTILKPSKKNLVYSDLVSYQAILSYNEIEDRIVSHNKIYKFNSLDDGFIEAKYILHYDKVDSINLPSFVKLDYTAYLNGILHRGQDITRVSQVIFKDFIIPEKLIYKIKEAPYSPEFWENYNRVR